VGWFVRDELEFADGRVHHRLGAAQLLR